MVRKQGNYIYLQLSLLKENKEKLKQSNNCVMNSQKEKISTYLPKYQKEWRKKTTVTINTKHDISIKIPPEPRTPKISSVSDHKMVDATVSYWICSNKCQEQLSSFNKEGCNYIGACIVVSDSLRCNFTQRRPLNSATDHQFLKPPLASYQPNNLILIPSRWFINYFHGHTRDCNVTQSLTTEKIH